jgi:hypothetical protein
MKTDETFDWSLTLMLVVLVGALIVFMAALT